MKNQYYIFTYGFAIFAMFFGSGNLVFPLQIGLHTGNNWVFGFLGLLVTGIILPLLGLIVIKLYKGSYSNFFNEVGSIAGITIPLICLSLLGSFGVVPRCITVAHGGLAYIMPQIPLYLFSAVFCSLTFFLCLKDKFMISILGRWLSPMLLIALGFLILISIYYSEDSIHTIHESESLYYGFLTGYHTMDLVAAFFFSSLIFNQLEQNLSDKLTSKEFIKFAIKPSIFACILLGFVYLGFVYLGAHFSFLELKGEPEFILPAIAVYSLGNSAALILSMVIILSCITTAISLNNIYASYLCDLFNLNIKFQAPMLFATTSIAFIVSLLDFNRIANFLSPILEILYPELIFLTIICLITREYKLLKKTIFYTSLILLVLY